MIVEDVSKCRLLNHQLTAGKFKKPNDLVAWMGALQAQDYAMATLAVGIRVPGTTDKTIETAIDRGEIIRTHVLRPTWHLVSAKEAGWMLDLTAPHIKASLRSRHRELQLTPEIFKRGLKIMEKALSADEYLTREELVHRLEKGKVVTHDQRAAHIRLYGELDKIICSGPQRGKKNTYALFARRILKTRKLTREEALIRLIAQYFTSHGPATLQDLIWWSGLPVADARKGIELIKNDFHSQKIGAQTYWFKDVPAGLGSATNSIHLLPAFDEFIIAYKDRTACLPAKNQSIAISSNGIFRPVIVYNGQVIGLWKRTTAKNKTLIETQLFSATTARQNKNLKQLIKDACVKTSEFFGSR